MRLTNGRMSTLPTLWQLLYIALGASIVAGLVLAAESDARANHPKPNGGQYHIWTMDTGNGPEESCAESHISALTDVEVRDRVTAALTGGAGEDWHGTASGKIDIRMNGTRCDALSAAVSDDTELEYHAYVYKGDFITTKCGEYGTVSCAWAYGKGYNNEVHARWYHGYLNSIDIASSSVRAYKHVVSHESGHMFGLWDPQTVTCPGSVMHSVHYECNTDYYYPQAIDRETVSTLANS